MKLVHFLQEELSLGSREIKRLLERKHCLINGKIETFASYKLKGGEFLAFTLPSETQQYERLLIEKTSILYEDGLLLAYDKPAGHPSAPTEDPKRPNLYSFLKAYLQERDRSSLWMVHRLDRDTSGVLLFVKEEAFLAAVAELFRNREMTKVYEALTDGVFEKKEGSMTSYLQMKGKAKGWERWGSVVGTKGKYAETGYQVLQSYANASYLRLFPKTGRIHQLRVHLSERRHPILGDTFYGKNFQCPIVPHRHLLHAKSIAFFHPQTQEKIRIESRLPEDFRATMNQLKQDSKRLRGKLE